MTRTAKGHSILFRHFFFLGGGGGGGGGSRRRLVLQLKSELKLASGLAHQGLRGDKI